LKIYTRKGDDGTTSLWYGGRVDKHDARTHAYGAVDEAVSALGVARSLCQDANGELAGDILQLQSNLFVLGAELATAPEAAARLEEGVSKVTGEMADWAEGAIDAYMAKVDLPPKFVIPGGTQLSAQLDFARATIRRAERFATALGAGGEEVSDSVLRFLNRASDLAFAMARATDEPDPELFAGRDGDG
jgi:cob(I)alamin adenosyltransferase